MIYLIKDISPFLQRSAGTWWGDFAVKLGINLENYAEGEVGGGDGRWERG